MLKRAIVIAALIAAGSRAVPAAQTPDSVAAQRWSETRTRHFRLLSNASENRVRDLAELLEAFRAFLAASTRGLDLSAATVDTVYVFKDDASFDPFKHRPDREGGQLLGFFSASPEARLVALNATPKQHIDNARAFRAFQSPYEIVLHEYTHAILERAFPGLPEWLDEGMAVYFSTTWIDGRTATVGRPTLQTSMALQGGLPMTLDTLAKVPAFHALRGEDVNAAYGSAWATAHYLLVGNPERNQQFLKYLSDLASGAAAGRRFESAFGASPSELSEEVRAYVKRGRYLVRRHALDALVASVSAERKELDESEVRVLLGDFLAQTRKERRGDASALVGPILAKDPGNARALGVVGLVEETSSKLGEAERLYRTALSRAPEDPILRFRLARVLVQSFDLAPEKLVLPPSEPNSALAEARGLIESALLDRPDLDGAYSYLGLTDLGSAGDHSRGRMLLEESRKRFPRTATWLLLPLGVMRLWDGERSRALELLERPSTEAAANAASELRWVALERDRLEIERAGAEGREAQKALIDARIAATFDQQMVDQLQRWRSKLEPSAGP